MRVWVTRPTDDAEAFAAALADAGHSPWVEPLFTVETSLGIDDIAAIDIASADGLIVTSRNALRAIADADAVDRFIDRAVFAVGTGTAQLAASLGFQKVTEGPGTGEELARVIAETAQSNGGKPTARQRVAFVRGAHITVDLEDVLPPETFDVTSVVAYRMRHTSAPSAGLVAAMRNGGIDAVTLFSPNAAQRYVARICALQLEPVAGGLVHYCLSRRIASELGVLTTVKTSVPSNPNLKELLALMAGPASQSMHLNEPDK